jgi:predicted nuclease of predicted toxin-antitoxin system
MHVFADHNVPRPIVLALRRAGIDVLTPSLVQREQPDTTLLKFAYSEQRIMLTLDRDFPGLVLHDRHPCLGLLVLQVDTKGGWPRQRADAIAQRILAAEPSLIGALTRATETEISHESL